MHLKAPMLRVTFVGERGQRVRQHWLDIPMGNGWIASYQLAYKKGQARILELRVVPDAPGRLPREVPRPRPYKTFSFDLVHRQIRERTFTTALESLVDRFSSRGWLEVFGNPSKRLRVSAREGKGAGRKGRPDEFYARLAVDYHLIEHDSRREHGESTRQLVADRRGVSVNTVGKWLQTACGRGFLTPVKRGGRRRMATETAFKFINA